MVEFKNFKPVRRFNSFLRDLDYCNGGDSYSAIERYCCLINPNMNSSSRLGLALLLRNFNFSNLPKQLLEISAGLGEYSKNINLRYPNIVCNIVGINSELSYLGKGYSPNLKYIPSELIFNKESIPLVFLQMNHLFMLSPTGLKDFLSSVYPIMSPEGKLYTEMTNLTLDLFGVEVGRVSSVDKGIFSTCLDITPAENKYSVGYSLWDTSKWAILDKFLQYKYFFSAYYLKQIAEASGFSVKFYTYLDNANADRIKLLEIDIFSTSSILIEFAKE